MAVTVNIEVSTAAVRALQIYTNNGGAALMKSTLEDLIDKWGRNYIRDFWAHRKAAVADAIDVDEDKLAAAEAAVGL